MTLHETYATLVRRGMPKHPRLNYVDKDSLAWAFWTLNGCPMMDGANEADVRDLLTMHALRWVMDRCAFPGKWLTIDEYMTQGRGIAWREEATDSYESYVAVCEGFHKTILDAIVVATKHLEPKQP